MHILVIEDEESLARIYQLRLEKEGHEVTAIDDGAQGGTAALDSRYDLIITDLKLPNQSGEEIITLCRQNKKKHQTPIIVVSSYVTKEVESQLTQFEHVDVLRKPLDWDKLFLLIKQRGVPCH